MAVATAGCFGGGEDSGGTRKSDSSKPVLRVGASREPQSLDAAQDVYVPIPRQFWAESFLQVNDKDGTIGPGLAESYGYVGKGNKVFEFKLREGARFSNGKPVNAAAAKAWLEYFPTKNGPWAKELIIDSIETPDDRTVRINLKEPSPSVARALSSAINWGSLTDVSNPKEIAKNPISAGQYVIVPSETVTGDRYTLVPNKYYYDQSKIHYSKVIVKVISTPSTMLQAIQSGDLDVALGDPSTAKAAESSDIKVYHALAGWAGFILEDRNGVISKPLGDVRVRQALNYAIDRSAIAEAMIGKYGKPTSQITTSDGFDPKYENYYSYDPAKAKQLLADAGYPNGFTFTVLDQGYLGNQGTPTVQAIAKYLAAVGVKVKIKTAATNSEFGELEGSNKYPAWQHMSYRGTMDSPYYKIFLAKGAPASDIGDWYDPVIERLRARAAVTPPSEVDRYWKAISRRTVTQAYFVPVYTTSNLVYATDDVAGVSFGDWWFYAPAALQWHPA